MKNDLVIIGGGIMGLYIAYFASQYSRRVVLLEKRTIGNKYCASSGFSRSIRNDYLDPYYSRLASESQRLWEKLERESKKKFIVKCGVLNIAREDVTPDLSQTYATLSAKTLNSLGFATDIYKTKSELNQKYPQFQADIGCMDIDAGFLYIPEILSALKNILRKKGVTIIENCSVTKVTKIDDTINIICANSRKFSTKKVVVAVGAWSLEMLGFIDGAKLLKLPIVPIQQILDYFAVPKKYTKLFSAQNMPVFAYLDVGIYGHPLYGKTPGLKVAYFDPLGAKLAKSVFDPQPQNKIRNNLDFIKNCFPLISPIERIEQEINYYDMTPDNNFIIDELPRVKNIYLAGGFCGTGFKFAPIVGKILAEMVFRQGTVYDIKPFSAKRFGSFANLSVIKSLPMYKNFIYPRNWGYLKQGIDALLLKTKLP